MFQFLCSNLALSLPLAMRPLLVLALVLYVATALEKCDTDTCYFPWDKKYIPRPRDNDAQNHPSSCNTLSDWQNSQLKKKDPEMVSFACTHWALGSDDMVMAARLDGLEKDFVYAVAGAGTPTLP
jgi:hypothetical protein